MDANQEKKRGKVFIIEDDFTQKVGLKTLLLKEGFEVLSAQSGSDTIPQIASFKPHILITDVDKNDPDEPLALAEKIKASPETKDVEIFIYTDKIDVSLEVKLRRLKLSAYFTRDRPVDFVVEGAKNFFVELDPVDRFPPSTNSVNDKNSSEYESPGAETGFDHQGVQFDEFSGKVQKGVGDNDGETLLNIGASYMEMGMLEEALHEFDMAARDQNLRLESLTASGVCLRKMRRFQESVDKLKEGLASANAPEDVLSFRYELGVTLEEAGMLKEAFSFLGSVYKADKTYRDTAQRLLNIQNTLKSS
jgi:tetratricopeptide (TPR) repeat protein